MYDSCFYKEGDLVNMKYKKIKEGFEGNEYGERVKESKNSITEDENDAYAEVYHLRGGTFTTTEQSCREWQVEDVEVEANEKERQYANWLLSVGNGTTEVEIPEQISYNCTTT